MVEPLVQAAQLASGQERVWVLLGPQRCPRLINAAGKRQLSRVELRPHGLQSDLNWRPVVPGLRSTAYIAEGIHPLGLGRRLTKELAGRAGCGQ